MRKIGAAVLLGLLLRLAVSWAAPDVSPVADMAQYHDRAAYLLEHLALYPDALRGPGYPIVLAAAFVALGESNWAGRVANVVIGGLLVLATGLLARAFGTGERAWISAAIVAAYPGFLVSTLYQMPDTLYALLLVACLLVLQRQTDHHAGRQTVVGAVALGVTIGAALLTRSVGLALIPAVAVGWGIDRARHAIPRRELVLRALVTAVACAALLAPWLSFSARVAGRPVLDTTSGYNALVGSNPRATGRLELQDAQWLAETYLLGAGNPADAELQGMRAAARWAMENPGRWAGLGLRKVAYLWGLEGREHSALYSREYFGSRDAATVTAWGVAVLVAFPLLVIAAIVGCLGARGPWTPVRAAAATVVVATTAVHVLSFGESRFHLPLVPLLAAVASFGWPPRHRLPSARTVAAAVLLSLFASAWAWQLPGLWQRLDTIRQPGGSMSILDY